MGSEMCIRDRLMIEASTPLCLLQDDGRFGVRHLGVTQGGAASEIESEPCLRRRFFSLRFHASAVLSATRYSHVVGLESSRKLGNDSQTCSKIS